MSTTKKVLLFVILIVLVIGVSAPFQRISTPIFFGFLPAPIFYLLIVHLLFVCLIGYLAFFTRLHGHAENEEKFLAEVRAEKEAKK